MVIKYKEKFHNKFIEKFLKKVHIIMKIIFMNLLIKSKVTNILFELIKNFKKFVTNFKILTFLFEKIKKIFIIIIVALIAQW